ncbi:hypothetical protein ILYODFUR_037954 [Ilyodon furcidens]|uniref:Uncharacterized protein n=1 Tax=Ilyodon furcidens TaxID=33524 RepID=A0ABV0TEH5_9TELE
MRFWSFSSDRRLLVAVSMLFWRLNLCSAATLETGVTSTTAAKVLKSGNISPFEVIRSMLDSLNEVFPDPASAHFIGKKQLIKMLTCHEVVRGVNYNLSK